MISGQDLVTYQMLDRLRHHNTLVPETLAVRFVVMVLISKYVRAVRPAVVFRGLGRLQWHGANYGARDPEYRHENDNHTAHFAARMLRCVE